jgi:hypothetical protein
MGHYPVASICFSITRRSNTCPDLIEITASSSGSPVNAQLLIDIFCGAKKKSNREKKD